MTMTRRIRAALVHLGISALVASIAAAAMLGIWFPPPYFEAMGADGLILILVAVDVILGPLVTLIVFAPGKARHLLVFDLAVIATLQAAAFSYGAFVISQARPVYMLFVRDRFEITAADEIRDEELAKVQRAEFRTLPHLRPRLAAAEMPTDPGEQMSLMMSAIQGVDLKTFPQYYVPYEMQLDLVRTKAQPLAKLGERHPEAAATLARAIAATGMPEERLKFLPLRARKKDMSVLVDAATGRIEGYVAIDPW
jgi:hypothetical protein